MKALGSTRILRGAAIVIVLCGVAVSVSRSWALEATSSPDPLGSFGPRIVTAEGGPGRNPLSSAAGYGQFLSGTWLEMFESAYPQVARTLSREQILALRDVKPLAEDLTNRYAQANAATLRSLGLPATAGELSLAHAIGPGGAVSVLTAEPKRPAAELLRPEAIAANPIFGRMTASTLRQWAAVRVSAPAEGAADTGGDAQPLLELVKPTDLTQLDERARAAEASPERITGTTLECLVDAISKIGGGKRVTLRPSTASWLLSVGVEPIGLLRGDPVVDRIFNRAGTRAILDAIREVSDRPNFREFKAFEIHAGSRDELPRAVVGAVAIALLDKIKGESAAAKVAPHRQNTVNRRLSAERSAAPPLRNAANPGGTAATPPL